MKKGMTIVYPEYDGLYINLTNRCPCACTFCIRQRAWGAEFDNVDTLWLEREPTAAEVIEAVKAECKSERFSLYKEFVFCGYGEPTEALDVLLEVARFLKANYSLPVRVNTNGLCDLINKKHVAPLFEGLIDTVSISLNSGSADVYEKTVRPVFGKDAYPALIEFAKEAVRFVPKVVMTTVEKTISDEDQAKCSALCKEIGAVHRIRKYIDI